MKGNMMIDKNFRSLVFSMNMDDLAELNRLVVETMRSHQRSVARSFRPGDRVTFSDKTGKTVSGTVIKVNQKTIMVKTADMTWRVSPTLLSLSA